MAGMFVDNKSDRESIGNQNDQKWESEHLNYNPSLQKYRQNPVTEVDNG